MDGHTQRMSVVDAMKTERRLAIHKKASISTSFLPQSRNKKNRKPFLKDSGIRKDQLDAQYLIPVLSVELCSVLCRSSSCKLLSPTENPSSFFKNQTRLDASKFQKPKPV